MELGQGGLGPFGVLRAPLREEDLFAPRSFRRPLRAQSGGIGSGGESSLGKRAATLLICSQAARIQRSDAESRRGSQRGLFLCVSSRSSASLRQDQFGFGCGFAAPCPWVGSARAWRWAVTATPAALPGK